MRASPGSSRLQILPPLLCEVRICNPHLPEVREGRYLPGQRAAAHLEAWRPEELGQLPTWMRCQSPALRGHAPGRGLAGGSLGNSLQSFLSGMHLLDGQGPGRGKNSSRRTAHKRAECRYTSNTGRHKMLLRAEQGFRSGLVWSQETSLKDATVTRRQLSRGKEVCFREIILCEESSVRQERLH